MPSLVHAEAQKPKLCLHIPEGCINREVSSFPAVRDGIHRLGWVRWAFPPQVTPEGRGIVSSLPLPSHFFQAWRISSSRIGKRFYHTCCLLLPCALSGWNYPSSWVMLQSSWKYHGFSAQNWNLMTVMNRWLLSWTIFFPTKLKLPFPTRHHYPINCFVGWFW